MGELKRAWGEYTELRIKRTKEWQGRVELVINKPSRLLKVPLFVSWADDAWHSSHGFGIQRKCWRHITEGGWKMSEKYRRIGSTIP
jgi:hypothetical protein